ARVLRRVNGIPSATMAVQKGAEGATELPAGVIGAAKRGARTATEAKGDQLILRAEVRLRNPAEALRRVVHRPGEFVRESVGAPVGPAAVIEETPAAGVHQPLDHRVG